MNKLDDRAFIEEIRTRLDRSISEMNPEFCLRLDGFRQRALNVPRTQLSEDNEPLIDSVLTTLDDNEPVAAHIEARLNAIRQQALTRLQHTESAGNRSVLERIRESIQSLLDTNMAMASMVATACVMVTVVSLFYVSSRPAGILRQVQCRHQGGKSCCPSIALQAHSHRTQPAA